MENKEYNSDSDSDDADFIPHDAKESEDSSDDDDNVETSEFKRKRKNNGINLLSDNKSQQINENGDCESNGEADIDFIPQEDEKLRTDRLWENFLDSVEANKRARNDGKNGIRKRSSTIINGEGNSPEGKKPKIGSRIESDVGSSGEEPPNSCSSSCSSVDVVNFNHSNNGFVQNKTNIPHRRISFLSGEPNEIGLGSSHKTTAGSGLSSVLNVLKSQKETKTLTTLEKSKKDWEQFKKQHNLEEDLHNHTKSKNTFLDKQEFLLRADMRSFEIEKSMRSRSRKSAM